MKQLIGTGQRAKTGWLALAAATVFMAVMASFSTPAQAYQSPWGQGESDPNDLVISLATFSPGDDVPSWFGHTGLVVEDRRLNVSRMYNYGMFNFDRDMLMRFAMGRLWFWVAPTSVSHTYGIYESLDRDIRVIELYLPPQRRAEVAEFLADNVRPENKEYLYHHYDDNCATRVRDVIDLAVGGQFFEAYGEKPARLTLRGHTRRHSAHMPPMDWLLMFLMNGSIDTPSTVWDEMFLPGELERRVLEFQWVDDEGEVHDLALRNHEVYRAQNRGPVPEEPPTHWYWWLLVGTSIGAVGLLIGWNSRRRPGRSSRVGYGAYHIVMGLLLGGPGLLLGVMAVGTEHTVTYWNLNLFWANPLSLGALILGVMVLRGSVTARRRLVRWWSLLAIIAAVGVVVSLVGLIYAPLYQDTSLPAALFLPIIAGSAACSWLVDGALVRQEPEGE